MNFLNVDMFLWWPHTNTHTQFCLACSSTFSCLEQTGSSQIKLDRTQFGQKAERDKSCIHLSDRVPSLLWHIESLVSAFGAFFPLSNIFFWTSWFCSPLGSENWTLGTGLDLSYKRERKYWKMNNLTGDKHIMSLSLSVNTTKWTVFIKMPASTFDISVFAPAQSRWKPKSATLCCGFDWAELDGSIYIHLVHFIGLSHIIEHIFHLFIIVFLLWICQCQILSIGTEVLEHGFWMCLFSEAVLLSPQWVFCLCPCHTEQYFSG